MLNFVILFFFLPIAPNLCDFEETDLCSYTQDTSDDFDWTVNAGRTRTALTGPSVDVTYSSATGKRLPILPFIYRSSNITRPRTATSR